MKKFLKRLLIIFAVIIVPVALLLGITEFYLRGQISNVTRLDSKGALYYAEYVGDYECNKVIQKIMSTIRHFACTAFITHDPEGKVITGRNYDLPHKDNKGEITGLNILLRCNPKDGFKSLNMVDAGWVSAVKIPYFAGALDKKLVPRFPLGILPYLCMDGINEKGLTGSILAIDRKKWEPLMQSHEEGIQSMLITELLRTALDTCSTVDEVIKIAETVHVTGPKPLNFHLFLTDANGRAVVLEWRNEELVIVETDAVTNFYVGSDDACDSYYKGVLKEKFITPVKHTQPYRYGYGHGYDRFAILTDHLENHIKTKQPYYTQMTFEEAQQILSDVAQDYHNDDVTSFTQYSVVYNNTDKTMDLWLQQDYTTPYHFSVL